MGEWVLLADDRPLTRDGLYLAARAAVPGGHRRVGREGQQCALEVARCGRCRLILLSFYLPDARGCSGFLQLQHLTPRTPIAVVSAREDMSLVEAAQALDAAGYLFKACRWGDIAGKLRQILAGSPGLPSEATAGQVTTAVKGRISDLSPAQRTVLIALADGRSNKQIAHDIAVCEATVKAHLAVIFGKLGVTNRAQALLAMEPILQAGERAD